VGDQVVVTVLRNGTTHKITIAKLAGSSSDGTVPTLGAQIEQGYSYTPQIHLTLDIDQGDPSQGLALALATYELLTEVSLVSSDVVAAVGILSADGKVSAVAGINQHARSAWNAHAGVLVIPMANCSVFTDRYPGMTILAVETLDQALTALNDLAIPGSSLPHC
jgi:PDZ domain-containing secreted protein